MSNYDSRILALAKHLGISVPTDENAIVDEDGNDTDEDFSEFESIEEVNYLENGYRVNGDEYLVLTDSEADTAADEYLDEAVSELVDLLTSGMDSRSAQTINSYFDYDYWKRDALLRDGRGFLASYDGNENEVQVNGDWYFIYQVG